MPSQIYLAALLFFITLNTYANNQVDWQSSHRPPASIWQGSFTQQGFADATRDIVTAMLPHYQHKTSMHSLATITNNMKLGKPVCHPLLFDTKIRREFAYFSIPSAITPSMRVVTTEKNAKKLKLDQKLSLESLLKNTSVSFALIRGRSYGKYLDDIIANHADGYAHVKIEVTDNTTLFKLLAKGRVDYVLAFPFELNYYLSYAQIDDTKFVNFSINGLEEYAIGSIACSKTPLGKSVVLDVNNVLRKQREKQAYIDAMTKWWPEEAKSERFKQFYQNKFLSVTQPTLD